MKNKFGVVCSFKGFLGAFLVLWCVNQGLGQMDQLIKTQKIKRFYRIDSAAKFAAKTVVLKFKPEYRQLGTLGAQAFRSHSDLALMNRYIQVQSMTPAFPGSKPIEPGTKDFMGREYVDLSLIYIVKFKNQARVEDVINYLIHHQLVEFAEPLFMDEVAAVPDDPYVQPDSVLYESLSRIRAFDAWDITQGDPNMVIGIVDTGTELLHEDLVNQIKYNTADPIDGLDNDFDGFVDNYYGWDTGQGDNNPSEEPGSYHGSMVAGCAAAQANNTLGIAGTGYNCKYLPVKISNAGALIGGYSGINYAAKHGCKIINLSWGGFGSFSQLNQNSINAAAINDNCLIVAAAGNSNIQADFYPASYDNVLSVTGVETVFSPSLGQKVEIRKIHPTATTVGGTYSFKVDMAAHMDVFTTLNSGYNGQKYIANLGTSFSSPTVAGAAALVRVRYPLISGTQAAELLRVNGSVLDTFPETRPESRYKIGRMLDMYKALTNWNIPSIRLTSVNVAGKFPGYLFSNDTLTIKATVFNYLSKANNLKVTMRSLSPHASVVDSVSTYGMVDSLALANNNSDPFKIYIKPTAGNSEKIELVLIYEDPSKNYYDHQGFTITVNPTYVDLDTNLVVTTVSNGGRIGYIDAYNTLGQGFKYNNYSLLYECGLLLGASNTKVSDCIRAIGFNDDEFRSLQNPKYVSPTTKQQEVYNRFDDSLASFPLGIEVEQRSYEYTSGALQKMAFTEYKLTNKGSANYDSLAVGLYADWDIGDPLKNRSGWVDSVRLVYTYEDVPGGKYAGMVLLTNDTPSVYCMDHNNQGGIDPNTGGFTTLEKFTTLMNGRLRTAAGLLGNGNDVSEIIAAKLYGMAPGATRTVGFAIIGADNLFDLTVAAEAARAKFKSTHKGATPVATNQVVCDAPQSVTITPTGGSAFDFYSNSGLTALLGQGSSHTLTNVSSPSTVYVVNTDSLFDSDPLAVQVQVDALTAGMQILPNDTLYLSQGNTVYFVDQSTGENNILWDFSGSTSTSSIVTKTYSATGTYPVRLVAYSLLGCTDTLELNLEVLATPTGVQGALAEEDVSIYPNPFTGEISVTIAAPVVDLKLKVVNVLGEEIRSMNASAYMPIDLSSEASGVYYIKLESDRQVLVRKVVKQD